MGRCYFSLRCQKKRVVCSTQENVSTYAARTTKCFASLAAEKTKEKQNKDVASWSDLSLLLLTRLFAPHAVVKKHRGRSLGRHIGDAIFVSLGRITKPFGLTKGETTKGNDTA